MRERDEFLEDVGGDPWGRSMRLAAAELEAAPDQAEAVAAARVDRIVERQKDAHRPNVTDGQVVYGEKSGTRYVLEHVRGYGSGTFRREIPKVKGKAARRADRAARRARELV
jgi:hypothetical protein